MGGLQYVDQRRYVYQVLPVIWTGGYRTFRRKDRRNWRPAKELPWRTEAGAAVSDLVNYAESKGWTRI